MSSWINRSTRRTRNATSIVNSFTEIDIDFLEIGTSNFETLLQTADSSKIGFSVEPIKHYLDSLPNKDNVIKVNAAITSNRVADSVDIYYIPEQVIDENNIPWYIKGCNSINNFHPLHIKENLEKYVVKEKVPLINIDEFLIKYKIRGINYLKIDTEGHDVIILSGLFEYLQHKPLFYYPKTIKFESNDNIPEDVVDDIVERARQLGYRLVSRGFDTILTLS